MTILTDLDHYNACLETVLRRLEATNQALVGPTPQDAEACAARDGSHLAGQLGRLHDVVRELESLSLAIDAMFFDGPVGMEEPDLPHPLDTPTYRTGGASPDRAPGSSFHARTGTARMQRADGTWIDLPVSNVSISYGGPNDVHGRPLFASGGVATSRFTMWGEEGPVGHPGPVAEGCVRVMDVDGLLRDVRREDLIPSDTIVGKDTTQVETVRVPASDGSMIDVAFTRPRITGDDHDHGHRRPVRDNPQA